ncbi:MAG: hypothetical protein WEE50_05030, partial [Chloroflexota bacterium]
GMVRQVRFLVTVEELADDSVAAQASSGRGGDEHASERTGSVRERARGGANEGMSRISGDTEKS